jgi:hypothetical protein
VRVEGLAQFLLFLLGRTSAFSEQKHPVQLYSYQAVGWQPISRLGLGASDRIIQRFLRHSKATVAREHYIKAVPDDLKNAMLQLEAKISSGRQSVYNLKRFVVGSA